MSPIVKDLLRGGVKAGGFAASTGIRSAAALASKLKDASPFGDSDSDAPDSSAQAPAGERSTSTTGRFTRETPEQETPKGPEKSSKAAPPLADPPAAKTKSAKGTAKTTANKSRPTAKAGSTSAGSTAAGTRPTPARISNPKAAKAARKRAKASHLTSVDAPGATGKGGKPGTVEAENVPTEMAAAKTGRQAAPMNGNSTTE